MSRTLEKVLIRASSLSQRPMLCRNNLAQGFAMPHVFNLRVLRIVLAAALLVVSSVSARGFVVPASVSIETTSMAAGLGMSWGNGRLRYDGRSYGFTVN